LEKVLIIKRIEKKTLLSIHKRSLQISLTPGSVGSRNTTVLWGRKVLAREGQRTPASSGGGGSGSAIGRKRSVHGGNQGKKDKNITVSDGEKHDFVERGGGAHDSPMKRSASSRETGARGSTLYRELEGRRFIEGAPSGHLFSCCRGLRRNMMDRKKKKRKGLLQRERKSQLSTTARVQTRK